MSGGGQNVDAMAELMKLLTSKSKGSGDNDKTGLPTLRDILRESSQAPLVSMTTDVTSVCKEMAASKKAAVVVAPNEKVRW